MNLASDDLGKRWAIVGAAGGVGRAVGAELERRAIPFRALGRRQSALDAAFAGMARVEIRVVDVADHVATAAVLAGVDTAIYAIGVPYTDFALHPALMRSTVQACFEAGVRRLVVLSNVYVYGFPQTTPVRELHPLEPHTFKGKMRLEQERVAFEAHEAGQLRVLVVRPPDFYGPHADNSYAATIFQSALEGKPATLFSPVDLPHQFAYVPDIGAIVAELAARDDAYGEAYNIGGPTPTVNAFAREIYAEAGAPFRLRSVGKLAMRAIGIVNPVLRELVEMWYLNDRPVILDDGKLRGVLGTVHETPLKEAIATTIAWMQASNSREI